VHACYDGCAVVPASRTAQGVEVDKPSADKQLNFQFYRNPAAILGDDNQQVRLAWCLDASRVHMPCR
jgi:hypothetical protein